MSRMMYKRLARSLTIGSLRGVQPKLELTKGASASESPIIRSVSEALISLTLSITTSISKALARLEASAAATPAENSGSINTLNQDPLGCITKYLSSFDRDTLSVTCKGIRHELGQNTVRLQIKPGCSKENIKNILESERYQNLHELVLKPCNLDDVSFKQLENLKRLNFYFCRIGDEGASALAGVLPSGLTTLNLGNNQIGAAGAIALAGALRGSRITELNLEENQIGYAGAIALAGALRGSGITVLNLMGNQIGDEGRAALEAAKRPGLTIHY